MSIYDCTTEGPYRDFLGKRVVVSVGGVYKVALGDNFENAWKRAVDKYVEINGLSDTERAVLESYKPTREAINTHVMNIMPQYRDSSFPTARFINQIETAFKERV